MTGAAIAGDRLAPGTHLGDYRIDGDLPGSWNVEVYAATHIVLPRCARIVVLHAAVIDQQTAGAQLLLEACLLDAMHHPGVPRVFSTGVIGRRPWIAYELIQGVPLTETLLEGPLEVAEVLALLRDVASVLEHAHRRNIVHRNLRPDVLLNAPGRAHPICITGWSDARVDDGSRERVDHRADVFALGAVAFTALTGTWTDELTAVQRAPGAPRGLTLLIDRMLAPEPEARPSCAEVRATAIQIVAELTKASAPSEDDGVAIEEVGVELVDIAGDTSTSVPARRQKWTSASASSAVPKSTSSQADADADSGEARLIG